MMKKEYLRPGFNFALAHAIEEAGEFIAAAGKTDRWGLWSVNPELPPEQQEANADWMLREMRDLRGALNRLSKAIEVDRAKEEQSQQLRRRIRRQRIERGYHPRTLPHAE